MYCGEIMEEALTADLFKDPKHPYTEGLLSTLPKFGQEGKLPTIPGVVPPSGKFPEGCVFSPRCKYACEECKKNKPNRIKVGEDHYVRCFKYKEESHEE